MDGQQLNFERIFPTWLMRNSLIPLLFVEPCRWPWQIYKLYILPKPGCLCENQWLEQEQVGIQEGFSHKTDFQYVDFVLLSIMV